MSRRAFARVGLWAAVLGLSFVGRAQAQQSGAPSAEAGTVRWSIAAPVDTTGRGDARTFWGRQAAGGDMALVRRWALASITAGDTLRGDSLLASPAFAPSIWAWEVLRQRTDLHMARGDTLGADTLLASAERERWPDTERAAWLALRARLRVALRDTAGGREFARQVLRVYPSIVSASASGIALLERTAAARGESLDVGLERAAAEVELLRADRSAAARRLRRLLPRVAAGERWRIALRLAEVQRAARRPLEARIWGDTALRLAPPGEERMKVQIERARALRDAAKTDSALALYGRIARSSTDADLRATAAWEAARECEDRSRWREAIAAFARVSQMGGVRSTDARVQRGLVLLVIGERDSASLSFASAGTASEAALFWRGITLRAADRAQGDTLLAQLARRPGYAFYRACARETLGVQGWPGGVAQEAADSSSAILRHAAQVRRADGAGDDAMLLLSRWAAADARRAASRPAIGEWLTAARMAFGCGRTALGTLWVDRAIGAAQARSDSLQWTLVPWAYPPAFAPLVRAAAVDSLGMDASLLWALMRQESRFDPRARSKSNALGLTQLKTEAAGDMAKLLHDPPPSEATLFDPAHAIRYGARYLEMLLRRFDRHIPVALAAYNAGPSAVRKDWRELIARGGEALYCELASNADSQDYAKRISGFRLAYKELRPQAR